MSTAAEYKNNLLKFDLQSFLNFYTGYSALKLKSIFPDTYKLLASQLALYPKAVNKLTEFTSRFCYLTAKAYEQASSEAAAWYKASLFSGGVCIDLSGGLGIDDIAFSRKYHKVISVDCDSELNMIAEVNFTKMGISNITRLTAKAEEYIKNDITADIVYIDADRRETRSGKKAVTMHDSSPAIPAMIPRLFEISGTVLLKLSPLVDITYLKRSLPCIKDIRVVSVDSEVKEILVTLDKKFTGSPVIYAVNLSGNEFNKDPEFKFKVQQFPAIENKAALSSSGEFLFEAAPAIIKSGLLPGYAEYTGTNPVSKDNIYLTSGRLPADYFGRAFRIVSAFAFSKSALKKYLSENNITKANIASRCFPVKPSEIKKQFSISDGGEDYLFFTTGKDSLKLVYHCRKI